MANRKVLINYHTSGSSAPVAADVFQGEIVVAHETGKETLFTKNNANEMVPFISCAQTMTMIDEKIADANRLKFVQFTPVAEAVEDEESGSFIISGQTDIPQTEIQDYLSSGYSVYLKAESFGLTVPYMSVNGGNFSVTNYPEDVDKANILVGTFVQSGSNCTVYMYRVKRDMNIVLEFDEQYTSLTGNTQVVSGTVQYSDTEILGFMNSGYTVLFPLFGSGAPAIVVTYTAQTGGDFTLNNYFSDGETYVIQGNVVQHGTDVAVYMTRIATYDDIADITSSLEELSATTGDFITETNEKFGDVEGYLESAFTFINSTITNVNNLSAGTIQLSADTHNTIVKLSGDTEAAITAAIQALDSSISASSAGKYFTALAIEDGKLVAKEEADIPVLSVESAGTGNVVSQITVQDHKISYQTASVATSEGIAALSASVINLSAVTSEFSAATDSRINELSGYTKDVDDKVEALSASVISLSAATTAISNNLTILSSATEAISGYAHGEIVQLSGAVQNNVTNISRVSGDVIELSAATEAIATNLTNLSAVTLTGVSLNNTPLTVTDHIVSVPVTVSGSGIANATDSGSVADALAVKEYVENLVSSAVEYKGATGSTPASATKGDLYIASGDFQIGEKNVETGDFIIYDGTKWDVIEKNLDGAITGNLTQNTVTLGDSTNSVKSLQNGSNGQVLTMVEGAPAWANDPELTVVTAGTGTVVTDITASDHEITFTKGVTAADNADLLALSGVVGDFSAATDTKINALSAGTISLVAASAASVFTSAKTYVDEQIDEVYASAVTYTNEKVAAEIALLDSVGSASTTGHYLTSVTITDGKISAVGEVAVPAAVAITATTATPVDTASAVLTGVTADGTDNHNLTFGMSNKVFSAVTSDSAITSESAVTSLSAQTSLSALTSVSAISATTALSADTTGEADKVANALSISGYATSESTSLDTAIAFDGSAAKSLTFGKDTAAGKSMSMTSAGLVDVEIIDCGTY